MGKFRHLFWIVGYLLAACGGGGGATGQDQLLTSDSASTVFGEYLNNVEPNARITVDFSGTSPTQIQCTVLGTFVVNGRRVCVVYGDSSSTASGSPKISTRSDYVLRIPTGDAKSIRAAMEVLKSAAFYPILNQEVVLGSFAFHASITGAPVIVRDVDVDHLTQYCEVRSSGASPAAVNLIKQSAGVYGLQAGSLADLAPGDHTIVCTFTNSTALSLEIAVYSFQVLEPGNTPPQIAGMAIVNSDQLQRYAGAVRDINGIISVAYDSATDAEDDAAGIPLAIEGYVVIDGVVQAPIVLSGKQFDFDISSLGGAVINIGFRAVDSVGATTVASESLTIDANTAPQYQSGLQNLSCFKGQTIPLPTAQFEDAESDAVTVSYSVGHDGVFDCPLEDGQIAFSAQATDSWGAGSQSPTFSIVVSGVNQAPLIDRGEFLSSECFLTSYFCTYKITLPTCSDPNGNLPAKPVVFNGDGVIYDGNYASGQTISVEYSSGRYYMSAYCADDAGATSETLTMMLTVCAQNIYGACIF